MTGGDLALLCLGAGVAGFVDAVVGGGGLVSTPTLLIVLPELPVAAVLGTNKCSSIAGTIAAATHYARHVALPWRILVPGIAAAVPCSLLGAALVSLLDPRVIKPLILAVLVAVAWYTWRRKDLGSVHAPAVPAARQPWYGLACGALLGFYDGFLGPGTGSFLTLLFVVVVGCDFLHAAGAARVLNCATNLGALTWFAATGSVLWAAALPMAACNILGSAIGSRLAIAKGSRWVRRVFLAVVAALIVRLAWDVLPWAWLRSLFTA